MKPVNSKEINPEYFTRRTGAEAEAPILWSPVMKTSPGRTEQHREVAMILEKERFDHNQKF